jgi:uncharacterized protein with PQ loop repeat
MSLGLRHLGKRKGIQKKAGRFGSILDHAIYCAAIVSPFALLPQVLQLYQTQDASSLSLPTWLILGCMNCLWLTYGLYHHEVPITITNILLMVLNFATVVGIMLYQ